MECAACQEKTSFGSTLDIVMADRMWCSDRAAFYGDYTCCAMLTLGQL